MAGKQARHSSTYANRTDKTQWWLNNGKKYYVLVYVYVGVVYWY